MSLFPPTGNHRLVAMGCLNICAQCAPSDIGASLNVQETPYQYAVLYFAEHTRLANLVDSSDGLFQALKEFVFCDGEPSLTFINWVDEVRELSKSLRRDHPLKAAMNAVPSPHYSPLYTACRFCIPSLIEELNKTSGVDWNQKK